MEDHRSPSTDKLPSDGLLLSDGLLRIVDEPLFFDGLLFSNRVLLSDGLLFFDKALLSRGPPGGRLCFICARQSGRGRGLDRWVPEPKLELDKNFAAFLDILVPR